MEELKEVWKDIVGYEGYYQVSNLGGVKSLDRIDSMQNRRKGKKLKLNENIKGYYYVILCKNGKTQRFLVHRLVASAFISNTGNKSQVNHKDGNKRNNKIDNLEWCSCSENIRHAYDTGLMFITNEAKKKMSESHKGELSCNFGKKFSEHTRKKMSESHKGKHNGKNNNMYGKHHTEETKKKIADSNRNPSEETRKKISESRIGIKNPSCRKIKCLTTGEEFNYIKEASEKYNIKHANISACLRGKQETAGKHPITNERMKWEYL